MMHPNTLTLARDRQAGLRAEADANRLARNSRSPRGTSLVASLAAIVRSLRTVHVTPAGIVPELRDFPYPSR